MRLFAAVAILGMAATSVEGGLYTSDVVALNSRNWKQVLNSPHGWFINFCREG